MLPRQELREKLWWSRGATRGRQKLFGNALPSITLLALQLVLLLMLVHVSLIRPHPCSSLRPSLKANTHTHIFDFRRMPKQCSSGAFRLFLGFARVAQHSK